MKKLSTRKFNLPLIPVQGKRCGFGKSLLYNSESKRIIFVILLTLFVLPTFNLAHGQSELLNKLSTTFVKNGNDLGYTHLGNWFVKAEEFPLTNEIYLQQGNVYLFVAFQEYKNPKIGFSLTKVFSNGSTKFLGRSSKAGETAQTMSVDAVNKTEGVSFHFSLEQSSSSNHDTMVAIFYKSKDNESKDHNKNSAENYLTQAALKGWPELIHNKPRKQNPHNYDGVDTTTLTRIEIENVKTKTIVWKGDVSDMYSISDNYVAYGLTTKNSILLKDEVNYIIENMKTGKRYPIESEYPVFLINDSLVYRPNDYEEFKARGGSTINFKTNQVVKHSYFSTNFDRYQSKSSSLEKAIKKGFKKVGLYTIKKTGQTVLWLGNGYYIKNPHSKDQRPELYDSENKPVNTRIVFASFSDKLYDWKLDKPGKKWVGEERFYIPRFGRYDDDARFIILTELGYRELNTKNKTWKAVFPKIHPTIVNNKYKPDYIQLERGLLYISAYETGTSERVKAIYDLTTQEFKYYGGKTVEKRRVLDYLMLYEHPYGNYTNVISPKHLKPRLVEFE